MWAYEELLELYEKEKDAETKERLLAIKLYYEGYKDYEIGLISRSPVSIR